MQEHESKILQGLKGCLADIGCKVLQDNNDITTSKELSVEIEVYYNAFNKGKSYMFKGCQNGVMNISMVYMCIGFEHYLEPHKRMSWSFNHLNMSIHLSMIG